MSTDEQIVSTLRSVGKLTGSTIPVEAANRIEYLKDQLELASDGWAKAADSEANAAKTLREAEQETSDAWDRVHERNWSIQAALNVIAGIESGRDGSGSWRDVKPILVRALQEDDPHKRRGTIVVDFELPYAMDQIHVDAVAVNIKRDIRRGFGLDAHVTVVKK